MNWIEWASSADAAYLYLAFAAAVLLAWRFSLAWQRRKEAKRRSFQRKLETVLLPRETVKVICPQKKGQWILTSRRLLLETKEGFTALKLTDIKKLQGTNAAGNRTTAAKNMVRLTVKAEKEYTIENTGEEFITLYPLLAKKVKKKKK